MRVVNLVRSIQRHEKPTAMRLTFPSRKQIARCGNQLAPDTHPTIQKATANQALKKQQNNQT